MPSPYDVYDPDRIGWLHRKHDGNEAVTTTDVIRLLKADPANGADPVWQHYALKALEGELDRQSAGRPKSVDLMRPAYIAIEELVEMYAEDIAKERKREATGEKGRLEPKVQAANEIGEQLKVGGRTLLNNLSKRRAALKSS